MAGVATTEKAGYSGLGSAEFLKKIMTKARKECAAIPPHPSLLCRSRPQDRGTGSQTRPHKGG